MGEMRDLIAHTHAKLMKLRHACALALVGSLADVASVAGILSPNGEAGAVACKELYLRRAIGRTAVAVGR